MSIEKKQCTFKDDKGRMCPDLILQRKGEIRAHWVSKHGIDPFAEKEPEIDPATVGKREATEGTPQLIAELNKKAAAVIDDQVARLRKNAPNVKFGTSTDKSELEQKTEWARNNGIIKPGEHPYWAETAKLAMAVAEGRSIPTWHGDPIQHAEMTLTVRPKAIAEHIEREQQDNAHSRYQRYIEQGQAQARSAVPGKLPAE